MLNKLDTNIPMTLPRQNFAWGITMDVACIDFVYHTCYLTSTVYNVQYVYIYVYKQVAPPRSHMIRYSKAQ
jgi:hypothetical protein